MKACIAQGECYYKNRDDVYRENTMAENLQNTPQRVDTIAVSGKEYTASNFGTMDTTTFSDIYVSREYWRLEDAYQDFAENPKTGDVLPYNNYPMSVEAGQVFIIDYRKADGSILRTYLRSDPGDLYEGMPTTAEIAVEEAQRE